MNRGDRIEMLVRQNLIQQDRISGPAWTEFRDCVNSLWTSGNGPTMPLARSQDTGKRCILRHCRRMSHHGWSVTREHGVLLDVTVWQPPSLSRLRFIDGEPDGRT
jgi:hypothetical protein